MLHKLLPFFICRQCLITDVSAQSASNFIIESFVKCQNLSNQTITLVLKPKTFIQPQVVDITLITRILLGNQLKVSSFMEIENKFNRKNWQYLFQYEDDFCRVMHLYVGPFAYDVEYAMGIPRGVCPIPKGHYHAVNYTFNFNLLKLQTFPFGRLRVTYKYIEKATKSVLFCAVIIISNMN